MKSIFPLAVLLGALASTAGAVPALQLGASPARFDPTTRAALPASSTFTLYAVVDANIPAATGNFYICAAVVPARSEEPQDLGSFTFDGQTVPATAGMVYGSPRSLPRRSDFPTWYKEFVFVFDPTLRTNNYDVEQHAGRQPVYHSSGDALYREFAVDVSGLAEGATLVFDLYTYDFRGDVLPLGRQRVTRTPERQEVGDRLVAVPDTGATFALVSLALAGLVFAARVKRLRR